MIGSLLMIALLAILSPVAIACAIVALLLGFALLLLLLGMVASPFILAWRWCRTWGAR